MRIVGHGDAPHRVPVGVGIAVDQVLGIALAAFHARGKRYRDGHAAVDLLKVLRELHALLLVGHDGAFLHEERLRVALRLQGLQLLGSSVGGNHLVPDVLIDALLLLGRGDGHHACCIARDLQGNHAREGVALYLCTGFGWTDDEAEEMWTGLHAVVLQRTALSAAVAAESGDGEVEVQPVASGCGQFMWVVGHCQFLCRPGQYAHRHCLAPCEERSGSAVGGQHAPARVLMVGHVLRLGEVLELLCHLIIIYSDVLRGLAVGIVVDGTAAVVAEVIHLRGRLHHVAQSRQDELSVVGVDGGFHLDASVGADGVDNVLRELEVIGSERLVFLLSEALPVAVGSLEACAVGCLALNAVEHRNATVEVLHHLMLLSLML